MKKFMYSVLIVCVLCMVSTAQAATSTLESDYSFLSSKSFVGIPQVTAGVAGTGMAFLGSNSGDGQPLILVKDINDNFVRYISIFDPNWKVDWNLQKVDDANANGYPELAVKATNLTTGEVVVQIVDSFTGLDVSSVVLVAGSGGAGGNNTHSLDLESSSSQYASISDASQTGLDLTGDFTFETWVKLEGAPTNASYAIVGKWATGSGGYGWQYHDSAGTKNLRLDLYDSSNGSNNIAYTVNHTLPVGTWSHLAATFDVSAGTVEFFVDGNSVGTSTGSGTISTLNNSSGDFEVGRYAMDRYFDGLIDELRVWNITRTQAEISANMNQELTGSEAGLQGYWKFNNDYQDATANGNHLTPVNSPVFATDVAFGGGGQFVPQTTTVKIYADVGDGGMGENSYGGGDWNSHHSDTLGRNMNTVGESLVMGLEQYNGPAYGGIYRSFLPFDTSAIPATATIKSAVLGVYPTETRNDQGSEHWVDLVQGTYNIPVVVEDYDQIGLVSNPPTGLASRLNFATGNTDVVLNQYNVRSLNQTALGWIVKGGMTKLGLRQGNDILNSPVGASPNAWGHGSMLFINSSDNANQDTHPYLEITYTTP